MTWNRAACGACCLLGLAAASPSLAQDDGAAPQEVRSPTARANLASCDTAARVGTVQLGERPSAEGVKTVDIVVSARGLQPGRHAVHIHETGSCSPCSAAGGHFDPGPMGDTRPDGNHPFHAGDLVNIVIDDATGRGRLFTTTTRVTLSDGPLSLFDDDGSAIIIHVDPDSYCPGGEEAGCAGGARAACGVVRRD